MNQRLLINAALLATVAALGGCMSATSPATGRSFYSPVSESQEAQIGAEEHPKILQEFGGEYREIPNLNAYVNRIGQAVAQNAERKDVKYTFTLLNTDDINAFALPGGYVYITRGLVGLANNEAEVAGVLGHEIGHVNARHTAERMGAQQKAEVLGAIGVLLGSVLGGETGGQLAAGAANELGSDYLGTFSQQQEFEADSLGVRYLARTSYDPQAMATFLNSLNNETNLEAKLAGGQASPNALDQMKMSHPRTPERVQRAIAEANVPVANPVTNRDALLNAIDGIMFGTDPKEGVIKGRQFIHPGLRFAFAAPKGFRLKNTPSQVLGKGDNAYMIFDLPETVPVGSMADYVAGQWEKGAKVQNLQTFQANGLEAATGLVQGSLNNQRVIARLVAIRYDARHVYRFTFVAPPELFDAKDDAFIAAAQTFRQTTVAEVSGYKPMRLRVVTVQPGDTVESLASRMAMTKGKADWFRVLNSLKPGQQLQAGQRVKIVTGGAADLSALPPPDDAGLVAMAAR
jgi:predicted Zn-dependent protease